MVAGNNISLSSVKINKQIKLRALLVLNNIKNCKKKVILPIYNYKITTSWLLYMKYYIYRILADIFNMYRVS